VPVTVTVAPAGDKPAEGVTVIAGAAEAAGALKMPAVLINAAPMSERAHRRRVVRNGDDAVCMNCPFLDWYLG
jgi:hypothetical protein